MNPMMTSGSLVECLFEAVDCGGHHEFAELAVHTREWTADPNRRLLTETVVSAIRRWPYNLPSIRALWA